MAIRNWRSGNKGMCRPAPLEQWRLVYIWWGFRDVVTLFGNSKAMRWRERERERERERGKELVEVCSEWYYTYYGGGQLLLSRFPGSARSSFW
jgi:hypothetical protein